SGWFRLGLRLENGTFFKELRRVRRLPRLGGRRGCVTALPRCSYLVTFAALGARDFHARRLCASMRSKHVEHHDTV
ncbi:MAG: hypothetical protein ACR2HC_00585, partial [Thermoleophilaceae bacterium]